MQDEMAVESGMMPAPSVTAFPAVALPSFPLSWALLSPAITCVGLPFSSKDRCPSSVACGLTEGVLLGRRGETEDLRDEPDFLREVGFVVATDFALALWPGTATVGWAGTERV